MTCVLFAVMGSFLQSCRISVLKSGLDTVYFEFTALEVIIKCSFQIYSGSIHLGLSFLKIHRGEGRGTKLRIPAAIYLRLMYGFDQRLWGLMTVYTYFKKG